MKLERFSAFVAPLAMLFFVQSAQAAVDNPQPQGQVEAVFVLDTTSSMSGLIQAAKDKIWSIASTLGSSRGGAKVKVGLLAYRDRGDEYITKQTILTEDLDAVYKDLMGFVASGGGDGPESVNQALREAVENFSWSSDSNVYRVVFLVGDYPPHMDYQDDVKYPESVKAAVKKGLVINAIQCGSARETKPIWEEIARLGEGRYFQVEQSGNAVLASTPFDAELGSLSRELDATRLSYGNRVEKERQEKRERTADVIYGNSSLTAQASRAVWNASPAGKANFSGEKELINDVTEAKVDIGKINDSELPKELQGLSKDKREAYVKEKADRRKGIESKIAQLSEKRQAYIREKTEKKGGAKGSLDEALYTAVREQGARKGLSYDSGPTY